MPKAITLADRISALTDPIIDEQNAKIDALDVKKGDITAITHEIARLNGMLAIKQAVVNAMLDQLKADVRRNNG